MSKISQNLKDSFMGSMGGRIAIGAVAFTTAFLPMTSKLGNTFDGIANAQDVKPVKHHREMTAYEKGAAAQDYSMNSNSIGVFVNLAKTPEIHPEKIKSGLEYQFSQADNGLGSKGIDNVIYFNQSQGNITTITFFLKGTPFEYMLGDVRSGFGTVVKGFQQEQMKANPNGDLVSSLKP
jgi:hypothetical protein